MKRVVQIALAILIVVVGLVIAGGLMSLKKTPEQTVPPKPIPEVETITARTQDLKVMIPAQGTVEPATVTRAAAEVEGTVIAVSPDYEAGGNFKEGDVLLEIDPSDYKAALAQAESSLADAKLQVVQEEMKAEQAERDWERIARPGQTPNDLVRRIPQLAAARAKAEAMQAAVDRAMRDLERTKLRAPYDGRIRQKLVDLGTRVAKAGALAEFYATKTLEVRLPVPRQDSAFFDLKGQEIILKETGGQDRTWKAVVDRTEGEIQRANRSIMVVARIDGTPPDAPLPGQFVHTEIEGLTIEKVVRVPRRAFVKSDLVMIVGDGHTVTTRQVKVVRTESDDVLVSEGIKDGEQLCVTALTAVIEGMEVNVVSKDGKPVEK
ncbi:efflux RND transporter periplasmic adaptor subunit [Luteolibacter sp. GHJ8]|uniref:Efflux RND transporter periplasmic adaptor subunit n=1 Tax=Luteolibacter rhizosphaerae TaxID=2989719 RepID=A0ABT3G9U1_9BACT|nr:efflux RND transporter periplasmic adaptor subunit [Luteolibacter rhizosphaerae]MCW1916244.1 efflux RND transporter periplasmic adaptor subunit [Luteolibacter rhizosphaerae]